VYQTEFGIDFSTDHLDEEIQSSYHSLPLPLPITLVVSRDKTVTHSFVNTDFNLHVNDIQR